MRGNLAIFNIFGINNRKIGNCENPEKFRIVGWKVWKVMIGETVGEIQEVWNPGWESLKFWDKSKKSYQVEWNWDKFINFGVKIQILLGYLGKYQEELKMLSIIRQCGNPGYGLIIVEKFGEILVKIWNNNIREVGNGVKSWRKLKTNLTIMKYFGYFEIWDFFEKK